MTETLRVSHDHGVTIVTIDRPNAFNALDVPTKVALRDSLAEARTDRACRAILLCGAGDRAFCAGQDLREHVRNLAGDDPLATVRDHYNPIAATLFGCPKPVIAAVRGVAAGAGAALAFLADFRIGGPSTSFSMAFAGIGLAADTGSSYTLPRLVGSAKATEMIMLGSTVRADEARSIGLLTELADDDEDVLPTATELAGRLAAGPTLAFAQIKGELADEVAFTAALEREAAAQAACGFTKDHRGAVDAFVNKREPTFNAR